MAHRDKIALSLEGLASYKIKALIRKMHLNRDIIIGLIGDRGGGKSIGAAEIALCDFGVEPGEIIRSNMSIKANVEISDEYAGKFGLNGGTVNYESKPLEKRKFLRFDPEYYRNIFVIDEINIFLADARRSMSNQNLESNDVGQQLRKLESPLIYTCINEMFVDTRIRDLTDVFIKTQDTASTPLGLARKQPQGIEFQWNLYYMTPKLTGESYVETHEKSGPFFIRGNKLWGLIDTYERQERVKYVPDIEIEQDNETKRFNEKYGWIGELLIELNSEGKNSLSPKELKKYFPFVDINLLKDYYAFSYDRFTQSWDFGNYIERERESLAPS